MPPELSLPYGDVAVFALAHGQLQAISKTLRAAIETPAISEAGRDEVVSSIVAEFIALAQTQGQTQSGGDLHSASAQLALNRAMDYIEAHLNEAIRITSLCRYAGTTLRSLERIFVREFGLSPQQYVMCRRLNAVRRYLLKADRDSGISVTEVALSHGFVHLGRFAGTYRRYFGESPRATLQSQ